MSDPGAQPRKRRFWRFVLYLLGLWLLVLAGLVWYSTTESFQAMVHRRLVAEVERITGGRAELGSIHTIPLRFRVEIRNLTIHGREAPGDVPYAHVDRLLAQVKIRSILQTEFGFDSVVLDHPVIHIIFYPDGTTNQPAPQIQQTSDKPPVEQLFSLSISRLEVQNGTLLYNDQKLPMNFAVNDVAANMKYSFLRRHYTTDLRIGKGDFTYDGFRPMAWSGEAHFTLRSNALQVGSLTLTSGRSKMKASGQILNLQKPAIDANYETTIDMAEAAATVRSPQFRRGVLETSGHGKWSVGEFSADGKLALKDVDWRGAPVSLQNISATSQYSVTDKQLTLSQIQARLLGGSLSGDAEIANWLSSSTTSSGAKSNSAATQKGLVRFRFKDLSATELASSLSTAARPLNRLKFVGLTSGSAEARWKGSPDFLETDAELTVVPPAKLAPGQLPLNAKAKGSYHSRSGELVVDELTASTRSTQLRASGTLSSSASLRLSLSTTDLDEWRPVLASFGMSDRLPIALHGKATFNGTATGRVSDATLAGNLQIEDFDSYLPATAHAPERQVHWDSGAADIQVSRRAVAARHGTLRHGEASIMFDVSANLVQGQFGDSSPFTARISARNADLAEVLGLAGYNYPVSGTVSLDAVGGGTRGNPTGEGHIHLVNAVVYGEAVQRFDSDLRFKGNEVQLNNLQLAHYDARVSGGATYDLSSEAFRFNLKGKNFDLARIPQLQNQRVSIEGHLDFTADGSGTRQEPNINATIQVTDLLLDHERAGDLNVEATTRGANMHVVARSSLEQAQLNGEGDVQLRENWPSKFSLNFSHLDVDAVLRSYLHGRLTGHSAVEGHLEVQGPLRTPRELSVVGNLTNFTAEVDRIRVENSGPITFAANHQTLQITQLRLVGQDTDITATGTVQLTGDRQLDGRAQGSMNLALIESFNSDFTSSGTVAVDVTVGGTIARPAIQGRLNVSNGAIAYSDLPSGLSDINGSLIFNQDRLQIESLTAHTGGGIVTFGGYATSYEGQVNFDLKVNGQGVRLRYPPGVSSTASTDLHWVGTPTASTLSGDVTVTKLSITPGFDFGSYLARNAQGSALSQTNPILSAVRLDVHIVTTPELQMQTASIRLSGDADLHLRGNAAKPVLLGRADILEGEIYFNGSKYRLERGDVSFLNPVTTKPVLDLQMSTQVRDYDITVSLSGEPEKLHVFYRSEPPLPEADIITLLALGTTQEESAQLQNSGGGFSQEASSAILAEALNATVSSRAQRLFGVSRIRIDPQSLSTTETNLARGPQVTIEQQVANNLTITYSTNVSQASQQIIQVEYNINRNISIVGIRDQNGVVSIDVRVRQRKK